MLIIDISHTLDEQTPYYPGVTPTSLQQYKRLEADGFNAYSLTAGLHTGTHVDMPMHLTADARFANDFLPERFIGEGRLLDVRGERVITMKPQYREIVRENDIVLLYTGFDAYYYAADYIAAHPVADIAFADFLVERGVKMLGMDLPAPDKPPYAVHKRLLGNDIFVLENLTNLGMLVGKRFEVIALPLKLAAESSPVRAVCRILHPDEAR